MTIQDLEKKLSSKIRFEDVIEGDDGDLTFLITIFNGVTTAYATFNKDFAYANYKKDCKNREEQIALSELISNNVDFNIVKDIFNKHLH